jgi:hypothetical protein
MTVVAPQSSEGPGTTPGGALWWAVPLALLALQAAITLGICGPASGWRSSC